MPEFRARRRPCLVDEAKLKAWCPRERKPNVEMGSERWKVRLASGRTWRRACSPRPCQSHRRSPRRANGGGGGIRRWERPPSCGGQCPVWQCGGPLTRHVSQSARGAGLAALEPAGSCAAAVATKAVSSATETQLSSRALGLIGIGRFAWAVGGNARAPAIS